MKLDTLVALCASLLRCDDIRSKKLIFLQDSAVEIELAQARAKEEQYRFHAAQVQSFLKVFKELHSGSFFEIEVLSNEQNMGPYKTCQVALDYAFESANFVIFAEDDVIFSSDAMRWFDFCHKRLLGRDNISAIAGESWFFESGTAVASDEQVERLRCIADSHGLVNKYSTMNWVASSCFALTKEAWKTFGPIRGQICGDIALGEYFKEHNLSSVFPIVPRVKDIGMLHPEGHSVTVLGASHVEKANKNTVLMSEDCYLIAKQFEPYTSNQDELLAATSLLDERFIRLLEGSGSAHANSLPGEQVGDQLFCEAGSPDGPEKALSAVSHGEVKPAAKVRQPLVMEPVRQIDQGNDAVAGANALGSVLVINDYLDMLRRLHEAVDPNVYLEIGVYDGASLALSQSRSIGIDPAPTVELEFLSGNPLVTLYSMTSDAFFAEHPVEFVLGTDRVDLAFIDGLHQFDQVLRDFIHVERWSSPTGVVVIHDVIPPSQQAATRVCASDTWCGDVWQLVACLQQYRPDLDCMLVGVPPSGLLVVRNLDPNSDTLTANTAKILGSTPEDDDSYAEAVGGFLARVLPLSPKEALDRLNSLDSTLGHLPWSRMSERAQS